MKRVLLALCALVVAWPAMGKGKSQEAKPTLTTLHVTTHLVQVNVIALDHHGNPVRGLKRKDFKVFDDGKPQDIAIFRVESSRPPAVSLPKLPRNAFSNWAERAGYAPPSVTVILLDALNTPFSERSYARQQVLKFLEQLKPHDRVALYALGHRLEVLHDFTSDVAPLVEALRHYHGRYVSELHGAFNNDSSTGSPGQSNGSDAGSQAALTNAEVQSDFASMRGSGGVSLGAGVLAAAAAVMQESNSLQSDYNFTARVAMTTNALIAIANHLKGLPGRKNLIWVSGGFPTWNSFESTLKPGGAANTQDLNSSLSRAGRALNNVNLAIYPVDARGLILGPNASATRRSYDLNIEANAFGDSVATMANLAQRTGGRAFYNTNDIMGSIRRVVDQSKVTYVLAYYPKDVKWNGEFRKIKVRVNKRGLHLQYRHGYSAMPEQKAPVAARSQTLAAVMNSPLDATGIGLVVQMVPDSKASTPGHPAFHLRLQIDPREVKFERQDGFRVASLTLVTDQFTPKGESLKREFQKINVHLEAGAYQKALRAKGMGFSEKLPFDILPNTERVRVVICDNLTGTMGSVSIPLDRVMQPRQ